MNNNYKQWLNASVFAALMGIAPDAMAQAVIFPQAAQPGEASVFENGTTYELSNDLLTAKFVKQNGQLRFEGCTAMNLLPNSELFKIKLGDGTTAVASQMQLGEVRTVDLTGKADAAQGALRFDGKAIEADYTFKGLKITWSAILRDGSHYLRTHLNIKAENGDVAMSEITPMIYTVDNLAAGSTPVAVGNTRGAIIASDKIFAGLETPMGLNSTGSSTDLLNFKHDAWNANSFTWAPGEEVPQQILKNGSYNDRNQQLSSEQVCGTRGYLTFREAGEQTITFEYKSGNHRLNLVGVDVVNPETEEVVSSDYHVGYTGSAKDQNTYKVNIPKAGGYLVRYFVETRTESVSSDGTITYSKKVKAPVLVFDLPAGSKAQSHFGTASSRQQRALSANHIGEDEAITDGWLHSEWKDMENVPSRIVELGYDKAKYIERPINVTASRGTMTIEFVYKKGNYGLDIAGVDLIDANGDAVAYDYHKGFSGHRKENHVYSMNIPFSGNFKLRYFNVNKANEIDCDGDIKINLAVIDTLHLPAPATTPITGMWRRNTTLQKGKEWNVSAVVGLMAPGQSRRSVMSYIERERAVPWRAYPIYNSWYELNIDRNNDPNYTNNMNVQQCTNIVEQWKKNLYDKHGTGIQAFVWDDGWDQYGTWTFNKNFPNGFKEPDAAAQAMESGTGAWLGPVGGYGQSGNYRRSYWNGKGGMQLSNPDYYKVFYDACSQLIKDYDFRYFKFDGISAQWSSVGPDNGTVGEENAEGIIYAEQDMRRVKPDIFFNTTVGTWASPFWFHVSDAVWRQENDWGTIGNQGCDRERWITYRDRLVYQNFVQNSPLCPINCLMTHGFILTKFGAVSKDMNYKSILNELRCAFACGSGMVELYADYELLNSINNGQLWADMAECIKWQKKNEDVLPDIHWVGGNPWNGSKSEVYGWASWNGKKATFALRNGQNASQTYTTTLRKALDIPAYIKTSITLEKSFSQADLKGVVTGQPIDIDQELTIQLPALSVFVFDGVDENPTLAINDVVAEHKQPKDNQIYDLSGRRLSKMQKGVNIVGGHKIYLK